MDNNRNNNNQNDNGNRNRQSLIIFLVCLMVGLIGMSLFSGMLDTSTSRKITYDKFLEMLENKEVKTVTIKNTTLEIEPNAKADETGSITYHTAMMEDETALTERLAKYDVEFSKEETSVISEIVYSLLSFLIPFILFMVIISVFMGRMNRGGGVMGVRSEETRLNSSHMPKSRMPSSA